MITKFGKELRKLRLDLGITLNDMANQIGVSASLLSSAETGKKTATTGLIDKLADLYPEVRQRKAEFLLLAEETKSEVRIRLSDENTQANSVALAFARNFDSLTHQQLDQLMAVFEKAKKG